jgi:hypothetical protein
LLDRVSYIEALVLLSNWDTELARERVETYLAKASELDPKSPRLREQRAVYRALCGDVDGARELLRDVPPARRRALFENPTLQLGVLRGGGRRLFVELGLEPPGFGKRLAVCGSILSAGLRRRLSRRALSAAYYGLVSPIGALSRRLRPGAFPVAFPRRSASAWQCYTQLAESDAPRLERWQEVLRLTRFLVRRGKPSLAFVFALLYALSPVMWPKSEPLPFIYTLF